MTCLLFCAPSGGILIKKTYPSKRLSEISSNYDEKHVKSIQKFCLNIISNENKTGVEGWAEGEKAPGGKRRCKEKFAC